MFEFIRKYQYSIMLVVAIIVIIAFAFLYDPNRDSYGSSDTVVTMGGKSIREQEVQRIQESRNLLMGLGFYQYAASMDRLDRRYANQDNPDNRLDYVINTLLLRDEAKRLGVVLDVGTIEERIKTVPTFQTNGEYDPEKWKNFENNVTAFGFSKQGVFQVVSDAISYDKIRELVTAGVLPSPHEATQSLSDQSAKLFAATVTVPKPAEDAEVEVTDEEVATYYEENEDTLQTDPKRAIRYAFFRKPVREEGAVAPPETPAGQDAESAGDETPEENAEPGSESDEDFKKRERAYAEAITNFANTIVDAENTRTFADLVAADEFASFSDGILETAAFAQTSPPEALASQTALVSAVFELPETTKLGDPVKDADGYYFFEVAETIKPETKPLEEAREEIVSILKDQKRADLLNTAGTEAQEKIKAALEGGKPFSEAAKEAGFEAEEVPMFSKGQPPRSHQNGFQVANAVNEMNPGELSEPQDLPDGLMFVYLKSRELPLDGDDESRKTSVEQRLDYLAKEQAFTGWFGGRKENAAPQALQNPSF